MVESYLQNNWVTAKLKRFNLPASSARSGFSETFSSLPRKHLIVRKACNQQQTAFLKARLKMHHIGRDVTRSSVCVWVLGILVNWAKKAEAMEMLFGGRLASAKRTMYCMWVQFSQWQRALLRKVSLAFSHWLLVLRFSHRDSILPNYFGHLIFSLSLQMAN